MSRIKESRNVFGLLFFIILSLFLPIETAAQCGGTYFKRSATTNVPVNGFIKKSVDMTGDGTPDLVGYVGKVNLPNTGFEKLLIIPANGNGTFGTPITIDAPSGANFQPFIVGDYDNDNLKDIATSSFIPFTSTKHIYRNNGNGTYTQINLDSSVAGNLILLLDLNNDGKGDLINAIGSDENGLVYRLGNGDGTFQTAVDLGVNGPILAGDFNTDGKIDLLAGSTLFINQGSGTFSTVANAISLTTGEVIRDVRDFTGDGKPDILTFTQNSNVVKVSLLTNLGNNSFQRADQTIATIPNDSPGSWIGEIYVGNFSGDASPDVLYRPYNLDRMNVYTNDGAGSLSQRTFFFKFNADFAGDYDNDGKTDALRVSEGNFHPYGPHKFFNEVSLTVQKNVCNRPGQTRIIDFTRDGITDLSYWTPANGMWMVRNVDTVFWGSESYGDIPTPGDFDGDGTTDHAIFRNSTGDWWFRRSADLQPAAVKWGVPGDKPVVGDYDGDSISDLAVWRPSDGNWYILFMGPQAYTVVHWGQDGDIPVPEDYDGDGKTDMAIFRPSTGFWYYLKSSDLSFVALQFGLTADKPIAADYDGDGKADIAVYRTSENILHILKSSNLVYGAFRYGASGDILQPGDYDGDFSIDLGIYRPGNRRWISTVNLNNSTNFGAANIIPTSSMLRIE